MKYGEKLSGLLSRYLSRVNAWATASHGFFYSQAAIAIGHMGFGFLTPFHLVLERLNGESKKVTITQQPSAYKYASKSAVILKNKKHLDLKERSVFYRGLHRYVKTLSRLNEDFLMRPVANIFALAGGLVGLVVGLPISLLGFEPPKPENVTIGNQYFSTIHISRETRNFFGVMIWGGIAGYVFGSFYAAPITILGNTFQGASAFSGLFSGVATFVYELPTLVKNTWELAKKLVTKFKEAINWIGEKFKIIGEFLADKLGWLLDKGLQLLNWSWKKIKAGFTKCYDFASQSLAWVRDQFKFVLGKISKFLTVIKENGIRGLIAWIKDKTIGAVLRYVDNLSAVRTVRNELRKTVHDLLSDVQKTKAVFQLIGKQETDILANKTDNLNLVMAHIEKIAEAHRADYKHGGVQVKLNYLDTLKLSLDALKATNFDYGDQLSSDLVKLLDSNYRSWQSAEKEVDKESVRVDLLGQPSKTHLPQHQAALHQAQQQGASNDGDELEDELSLKKSWFSCCK